MNSSLSLLHPYPFEKLSKLFQDIQTADLPLIALSIGEPKHPAPEFVKQAIIDNFQHLSTYPNQHHVRLNCIFFFCPAFHFL